MYVHRKILLDAPKLLGHSIKIVELSLLQAGEDSVPVRVLIVGGSQLPIVRLSRAGGLFGGSRLSQGGDFGRRTTMELGSLLARELRILAAIEGTKASVRFTSKQLRYRHLRETLQRITVLTNERVLRATAWLVQVLGVTSTAAEHPSLEVVSPILVCSSVCGRQTIMRTGFTFNTSAIHLQ